MLPWAPCIQQGQITVTYNLFLNHSLGEDGKKCLYTSLKKQPTFGNATSGFPAKWCLSNEWQCRNSILMTCHYPDLGSASDWLNQISHVAWPIKSTTQIWVVMCHQHGISALVTQTSFGGETGGGIAKCWLFSQATYIQHVELYALINFFSVIL